MQEIHSIFICHKCRKIFMPDEGDAIESKCLGCGNRIGVWTRGDTVVDAFEDQEGLQALIGVASDSDVEAVAKILGYQGPNCMDARVDDSKIVALRKWVG